MLLWIAFAVMTAIVVAALARPLGQAREDSLDSRAADLAVYKDQLTEIETERSRGLLGPAEAEAARAEVARRMLARADRDAGEQPVAAQTGGTDDSHRLSRRFGTATAALIGLLPVVAALVYMSYGSPWLPDQPYAGRVAAEPGRAKIAELVDKVEARLRAHPEDGQGWDVLAPVYRRLERYPEAADAYRRAIALQGASPKRTWGLAESLIATSNGLVNAEARAALEKVVAAEPSMIDARFWLAAAKEQDGQRAAAAADYNALLAALPADTAWRKAIEERLKALGVAPAPNAATADAPRLDRGPANPAGAVDVAKDVAKKGPSQADMAAAERMTAQERGQMIERMVAGLAERLKADGRDLAGWQKLIRAYKVMGREPDAVKALSSARSAFKDDASAKAELDRLAASLSLGG